LVRPRGARGSNAGLPPRLETPRHIPDFDMALSREQDCTLSDLLQENAVLRQQLQTLFEQISSSKGETITLSYSDFCELHDELRSKTEECKSLRLLNDDLEEKLHTQNLYVEQLRNRNTSLEDKLSKSEECIARLSVDLLQIAPLQLKLKDLNDIIEKLKYNNCEILTKNSELVEKSARLEDNERALKVSMDNSIFREKELSIQYNKLQQELKGDFRKLRLFYFFPYIYLSFV
jgi:regulator of replication initiation timing